MDDRRAGDHAFNERGGTCVKCGMTWNAFWDRDSTRHQRVCTAQKPEPRESMRIPDDDERIDAMNEARSKK